MWYAKYKYRKLVGDFLEKGIDNENESKIFKIFLYIG